MKKKFKHIIAICSLLITVLSMNVVTFGQEISESISLGIVDSTNTESGATFEIEGDSSNNRTRAIWEGNSGYARLDYMESTNAFAWSVKVYSSQPMVFAGELEVYEQATEQATGKYVGSLWLAGAGVGSASGVAINTLKLVKGTMYTVYYSGVATAPDMFYKIKSGAKISFCYR